MVYQILKTLVRFGFKVHFKNIFIIGEENLPKDKPVLIVPNHSNALLDPIIIGSTYSNPLSYLTRGDIFKGKFVLWLFGQLNMFPIFRIRDGVEQVKKNEATFEKCEEMMRDGEKLVIFVEGDCIVEKRLRPLKKGMARLAFGSIEKYGRDLDIQIVPTGINYTHHRLFRKEMILSYGKPIPLSKYYETYDKNKARAIKQINKDVYAAMREHIVHIDRDGSIPLAEQYFEVYRNQFKFRGLPVIKRQTPRLDGEVAIANQINDWGTHDDETLQAKTEKANAYFEKLKAHKVEDLGVADTYKNNFLRGLILLLTSFVVPIGIIGNYIPAIISKRLADNKGKDGIFYATLYLVAGVVLSPIYWAILAIVLGFIFGWLGLVAVAAIGYAGFYALMYLEFFKIWRAKFRFNTLKRKNKAIAEELQKERQELVWDLPVNKTVELELA